jgi:hypothetical protein
MNELIEFLGWVGISITSIIIVIEIVAIVMKLKLRRKK